MLTTVGMGEEGKKEEGIGGKVNLKIFEELKKEQIFGFLSLDSLPMSSMHIVVKTSLKPGCVESSYQGKVYNY